MALTLAALALVSMLLVACARPGTETASSGSGSGGSTDGSSSGGSTVHMNSTNFVQPTVTISKGSSLTLTDDAAVPHIIQNGSWVNNVAQPAKENGAPSVTAQFNGNDSQKVGPFNTAGTFKLYCTIHSGMNLTVTVQ